MTATRLLGVDLVNADGAPLRDEEGEQLHIAVVAEQVGGALVADKDVVGRLSSLASSIEKASAEMLDALKRAGPSKATVEMSFGIAVESSGLVAVLGKGKGEAGIVVTLEWDGGGH